MQVLKPEDVQGAVSLSEVTAAVDAAMGRRPGTVLLKNAQIVQVITGEILPGHVLLAGRLIAGVGPEFADAAADEVIDLAGRYVAPGLIDGHVHLESALVTPREYARAVVPRGVTAVVCDPHEIANVCGIPGVQWLLDAAAGLPLDVWVCVPSCVPATNLGSAGAALGLADIAALLSDPRVVGVAEIMSFPAVVGGDPEVLAKALLAEQHRKRPDGHAPLVTGRTLQAYFAAGIASDHEATTLAEGREKLRAGCFLMVREGSVTRNLAALAPLVTAQHLDRIGFVTDDRLPHDLLTNGGVDYLVRYAVRLGVDPVLAVRCASWNTARYFQLQRRGAVAPGYVADLAILDDLPTFAVQTVYKDGQRVAAGGSLVGGAARSRAPGPADAVLQTVNLPALTSADLQLAAPVGVFVGDVAGDAAGDAAGDVRCIELVPDQILTRQIWVAPTVVDGAVVADPARDVAKLACVERHGRQGRVGVGLVRGFGLRSGAIASSVAHDHHNLLVAGVNDADMLTACQRLAELGGGFVAVEGGRVLAEVPLPIAGLITDQPLGAVRDALEQLETAARTLGVTIPSPFMALSFLGLEVIPELRLTDLGLVDVNAMQVVPLGRV